MASEEYASRLNTPASATFNKLLHSNHSQPHVESPLRKQSFPTDTETNYGLEKKDSHGSHRLSSEHALESETEDDELYAPPQPVQKSKTHGTDYDPSTADLGPRSGNFEAVGGFIEERGYGVPILASDEVAKTPEAEYMQPAVSPVQERRGSNYHTGADSEYQGGFKIGSRSGSRSGSASNSRPTSRPGSIHSLQGLSRFSTYDEDRENMHTPLEDVDEYEPLFPDEEGSKRPVTVADRLKLREQMKRFPSKDIWEDTPNSLQLQATVGTPEPSTEPFNSIDKAPATVFETPEQESARKGEVTEEEKAKLMPKEERLARSNFKPHLRQEIHRPGLGQRFPSRDIWEDSPDSARLETTVGDSQVSKPKSPIDEGLEAGAVVQTSGAPIEGIVAGEQARDGATAGTSVAKPNIPPRPNKNKVLSPSADLSQAPPIVPSRPPKRLHQVPPADAQVPTAPSKFPATLPVEAKEPPPSEIRKGPILPERPKPQASGRPAKVASSDSSESVPLSKIMSTSSVGIDEASPKDLTSPPPAPKPKPAVPARPVGGKIASLKAGFLSDLDSRLKLGPQSSKPQEKAEPEVEEEKAPLADARKGRAKGPARRKPVVPVTTESAAADSQEHKVATGKWQIQKPWTVWEHDGALKVGQYAPDIPASEAASPDDVSKAPIASGQTEKSDGAKEMQQAKLAVEESLKANRPPIQKEVQAPDLTPGLSGVPTSTAEKLNLPSTERAEESALSPSAILPPTEVNAQSQTEGKPTTVQSGNERDEQLPSTGIEEKQAVSQRDDSLVQDV